MVSADTQSSGQSPLLMVSDQLATDGRGRAAKGRAIERTLKPDERSAQI